MGLLGLLGHLLNFLAPAVVVGLLLAWLAPLLIKQAKPHHSWGRQALLNGAACALVLLGGLLWFGHDGKMASYAAMVLAGASSQWLGARAWRG